MKKLDHRTLKYIAKAYGKHFAGGGSASGAIDSVEDIPTTDAPPPETPSDAVASFDPSIGNGTPSAQVADASIDPNASMVPTSEAQSAPTTTPPPTTQSAYQEAFEEQEAANTAKAKAIEDQGKAEAAAINTGDAQVAQLPTAADVFKSFQTKDDQLMRAYQAKAIDPNHFYNSMGTGQKIASGIALLLGGFAGAAKQGNPVLAMMDKSIDRDIDAQKNDQGQAYNLWKMNRDEYGDEQAATLATKQQLLTGVQNQLQSAASAAKGPIAQANAQAANGLIKMEMARNNALLALHSGLTGQTQEGSTEQGFINNLNSASVVAPDMAKTANERYIPSVGIARVPVTPQDKTAITTLTDLNTKIDRASQLEDKYGLTGAWTPKNRADAREIQSELNVSLNQLFNLNRLTPIEYENFKTQIGNIGGINLGGTAQGLKDLKNNIVSKKGILLDQLGVTPFKQPLAPNQANAAQPAQTKGPEIRYDSSGKAWTLGANGQPIPYQSQNQKALVGSAQ